MRILLSDLADLLLSPLFWVLVLMVLAVLARSSRRRSHLSVAALLALLVFTNAFLIDRLVSLWEVSPDPQISNCSECVVLSGNILTYDARYDRDVFRSGSDRFLQAIRLVQEGVADSLFFSGRSGRLGSGDIDEASHLCSWARGFGVACDADGISENTWQSARYFADNRYGGSKVILLTSALHMRRARASFTKAGVEVSCYPVGPLAGGVRPGLLLRFETVSLVKWRLLLHEWTGMLYYRITGKA